MEYFHDILMYQLSSSRNPVSLGSSASLGERQCSGSCKHDHGSLDRKRNVGEKTTTVWDRKDSCPSSTPRCPPTYASIPYPAAWSCLVHSLVGEWPGWMDGYYITISSAIIRHVNLQHPVWQCTATPVVRKYCCVLSYVETLLYSISRTTGRHGLTHPNTSGVF